MIPEQRQQIRSAVSEMRRLVSNLELWAKSDFSTLDGANRTVRVIYGLSGQLQNALRKITDVLEAEKII